MNLKLKLNLLEYLKVMTSNLTNGMDIERYKYLVTSKDAKITLDELQQGWHFCYDWDEMLIHPNDPEFECCTCRLKPYRENKALENEH